MARRRRRRQQNLLDRWRGSAVYPFLLIGIVLAIIALSDTVQTADAVARKLDAKLFGTIHHEEKNKTLHAKLKHANKGLLITMPAAGFYFTEEIQKLATRTVQAAERHHARVLLITSVAENEGKSTVAANLALALAQQHFGFLKLSGETFLIDAYPVEVHPSDLAWVIVTFVSVSYLISVLTVRAMIPKKEISQNRP